MLHTYSKVVCNGILNCMWHIRGGIRKSRSVILGHYFYANSLFKWQQFLRKRGNSYEHDTRKDCHHLTIRGLTRFF